MANAKSSKASCRDTGNAPTAPWRAQIIAQIADVIEPFSIRCAGWPVEATKPILARLWCQEFGASLGEPGLTWCAEAVRDGRPWQEALWGDGPRQPTPDERRVPGRRTLINRGKGDQATRDTPSRGSSLGVKGESHG